MKLSRFLTLTFCAAAFVLVGAEAPTPDHVAMMKEIATLNGAINKDVDLKANATKMADVMTKVAAYWTPKDAAAGKLASDAAAAAKGLADGTGDAAAHKAAIGASCRGCHPAHREGPQGGPYMVK